MMSVDSDALLYMSLMEFYMCCGAIMRIADWLIRFARRWIIASMKVFK